MGEAVVHPRRAQIERIAFAQNAEDIVLFRAFRDHPAGFYVDVGSGDPTEGSVTKNLVDGLGWTGIDIEPQPALAHKLREARPRSVIVGAAVGTATEDRHFYRLTDNWGMSTLYPEIAERHAKEGWTVQEEVIRTLTLEEVLEAHASRPIDLLKVDVEGAELEVFKSFDLSRWRPAVIVAEATAPATELATHGSWERLLLDAGYLLCLFDGLNRFYARSDAVELAQRLAVPANVFDRFIQLHWWRALSVEGRLEADPAGAFAHVV